jgi:hypothetical protein
MESSVMESKKDVPGFLTRYSSKETMPPQFFLSRCGNTRANFSSKF